MKDPKLHIASDSDHREVVEQYLGKLHEEPRYTPEQEAAYRTSIKRLLKERNAVIVAHYYTDPVIQSLAEETVGWSRTLWKWPALAMITRLPL